MSAFLRSTALVLLAAAASACATARAAAPREVPALDVPMPPPRVIVPLPPPEPPPVEPVADLPGNSAPSPTRPRPQRQPDTAKPEAKPEEKTETPPNAVAPPVPQLRMPDAGNATQVSQQIRDIVARTRATLDNIDYRTLTPPRQKAYDDAKLFLTQAEEALKTSNLVVAKELADKAERLAKELQGR